MTGCYISALAGKGHGTCDIPWKAEIKTKAVVGGGGAPAALTQLVAADVGPILSPGRLHCGHQCSLERHRQM